MKNLLISLLAIILTSLGYSQTTNWKIDQSHSNVSFEVSHMVVATVTGKFQEFSGNITSDKADFTDVNISFNIQTASINTNNTKRDDHLRNADFFDAEKFPVISFTGKTMELKSGNKYTLKGDLSMHGVTKMVELEARFNGTIKDPWGKTRAGFKVTGELKRSDFGLTYNSALEAGGLMIGDIVTINVNLELVKQ